MEELRSPRVKFFGWLLLQERIQCRANLAKKNILDSDTRELCGQSAENCDHLVFHCPVANSFWTHLGLDSTSLPQVHRLWKMRRPDHIPQVLFSTMILCAVGKSGTTDMMWFSGSNNQTSPDSWPLAKLPATNGVVVFVLRING